MEKTIKPLGKIILLELVPEGVTDGGIIMPDTAQKEEIFRVLDSGSETKKVKKGDVIICLGQVIRPVMNGLPDNLRMIHEDGVIGVVTKK